MAVAGNICGTLPTTSMTGLSGYGIGICSKCHAHASPRCANGVQIGSINQALYIPAANLIKISIALFNRRITGLASKTWRMINDAFLGILACYMITYTIWIGTRCPNSNISLSELGKKSNPKFCNPHQGLKLSLGLVIIDVVLGFCLLLTPVIVLWKIQMNRIKKVQLFAVFAIGAVSCIGALMIIILQYQIHEDVPCMCPA